MTSHVMTAEQHEALRLVAGGGVWFDPRFHGVCGARADLVGDLDALVLTARGRTAINAAARRARRGSDQVRGGGGEFALLAPRDGCTSSEATR